MKKYFLFFNLFFLLSVAWIWSASAAKKYRYIKREHGVRFEGSVPMQVNQGFKASTNLKAAYAYNWGGMFEVGPYLDLGLGLSPYALNYWNSGLMVEYNFVKNRGRKKYVPAIGLSFGAAQDNGNLGSGLHFAGGVHGSLKIFVSTRTPFIVTLGYKALTPSSQFGKALKHLPHLSMGFSYYFDFY